MTPVRLEPTATLSRVKHSTTALPLKARDFNETSLSTYDFSTLYTTLPHNLIKDKLNDLVKEPPREKALLISHVMTEMLFLLRKNLKISCMVMSKCM